MSAPKITPRDSNGIENGIHKELPGKTPVWDFDYLNFDDKDSDSASENESDVKPSKTA